MARGDRRIRAAPWVGSARGRDRESAGPRRRRCRTGVPLCGLRLQDLDLTGHEDELLGRTDVEGMVVLGGQMTDALDAHLRAQGAWSSRPTRTRRSTPTGEPLPAARAVRRACASTATRRRPTPPTTGPGDGSLEHDAFVPSCGPSTTTRSPMRSTSSSRTPRWSGSWAAAPGPRHDGVCRGCPARPRPRRGAHGGRPAVVRERWRRRTSGRWPAANADVLAGGAPRWHSRRSCPTSPPGRGGPRGPRRPPPGPGGPMRGAQRRHPDVVLRARATERLLQRHRQVLLQRHPRGRAAGAVHLGTRGARGGGGNGAGDLPGGDSPYYAAGLRRGRTRPCGGSCLGGPAAGPTGDAGAGTRGTLDRARPGLPGAAPEGARAARALPWRAPAAPRLEHGRGRGGGAFALCTGRPGHGA